jgi:hypothetical protein
MSLCVCVCFGRWSIQTSHHQLYISFTKSPSHTQQGTDDYAIKEVFKDMTPCWLVMVTGILEGLGSKLLQNFSKCLPINVVSYSRRLAFSPSLLWKLQIVQYIHSNSLGSGYKWVLQTVKETYSVYSPVVLSYCDVANVQWKKQKQPCLSSGILTHDPSCY